MKKLSSCRILLVNIANNRSKRIYREYPLGLGHIGTLLFELGAQVKIFDMGVDQSDLFELVKVFNPHIIGLSFLSPSWNLAQKTVSDLRCFYSGWIISGGIHTSIFPEDVLKAGVDVAVIGEAELSIGPLIESLYAGANAYHETPGIAYLCNERLQINPPAETVVNLDSVPFINRELYHSLSLYSHHSLLTSRGCPYDCKFCCNWSAKTKNKCRARSPENVVDEIEYLVQQYQADLIYFADDIFFFNDKQRLQFCKLLADRNVKVKWVVQLRPDCINEKLLIAMKNAGCIKVCFGVEAGSQHILDSVAKKISLDKVRNALILTSKAGVQTKTWWIVGLPGNYEEQLKSLDLMLETMPNEISIHTLIPLPGSEYWDNADKYGIHISDRFSFDELYYHSIPKSVYYDYLKPEEITRLLRLFISELTKAGYKTTDEHSAGDQYLVSTPFEEAGFQV